MLTATGSKKVSLQMGKGAKIVNLKLWNVENMLKLLTSDDTFKNLRSLDISGNDVGVELSGRLNLGRFKVLDKINVSHNKLKMMPILPATSLALNISYNPFGHISDQDFKSVYNTLILIMRNCSIENLGTASEKIGIFSFKNFFVKKCFRQLSP